MKKVILFFTFLAITLFAGDSMWIQHDFSAAVNLAKKSQKPILLMYSAKT